MPCRHDREDPGKDNQFDYVLIALLQQFEDIGTAGTLLESWVVGQDEVELVLQLEGLAIFVAFDVEQHRSVAMVPSPGRADLLLGLSLVQ